MPNTPEYIFTPAGMPRTGVASPVTAQISRAVPSPPQNRTRSTPAARNLSTTLSVSCADELDRRRVHDLDRREARRPQCIVPHGARGGQPFDRGRTWHAVDQMFEFAQRLQRPRVGDRLGAEANRLFGNAVGAFESDAAAHPGDRIDEEAYAKHCTVRHRLHSIDLISSPKAVVGASDDGEVLAEALKDIPLPSEGP